jgi:hypothetical protein
MIVQTYRIMNECYPQVGRDSRVVLHGNGVKVITRLLITKAFVGEVLKDLCWMCRSILNRVWAAMACVAGTR